MKTVTLLNVAHYDHFQVILLFWLSTKKIHPLPEQSVYVSVCLRPHFQSVLIGQLSEARTGIHNF